MCEHCQDRKAVLIEEIRLLSSHKGEIYEEIMAAIDTQLAEEDWDDNEDYIRTEIRDSAIAQSIAIRAAFLAHYCDEKTEDGKLPPSIILGSWAGRCLAVEIEEDHQRYMDKEMRNRLGMNNN